MHPNLVNELTHFAHERGIIITIETEGSHFLPTDYPIDLISLSPKFTNSVPVLGVLTPQGDVTDQFGVDYSLIKELVLTNFINRDLLDLKFA